MKSPVFRLFLIFMFLCTLPFASAANKALVIGNNAYDDGSKFSRLSKITDADRIADALRSIGFSVTMKENLNNIDFHNTINNFAKSLQDTDIAFIYYAGHGLSYESNDYLVPVSLSIEFPESLQHVGIKAQEMLDVISARSKHTIFVIDASCRAKPFFRSAKISCVGFIQPNNHRSSYILYAEQKEGTAFWNDSTFSRVLAQELRQPQSIDKIFAKVREEVLVHSDTEQYPNAINNLSIESLYFMKTETAAQSAPAAPQTQTQTASAEELYRRGDNSYMRGDKQQARQFWEQAAVQGYAAAQGELYLYGLGVTRNYWQAEFWFKKAAAQGNADGQVGLGWLYQHDLGVIKNYQTAKYWYGKAAAQGNANGQNNLGYLYQHGLGVTKDYHKAKFWYERAAAQGDANGQNNLGYLYSTGLKDYEQAKYWFEKAAAQGNADGQNNLGFLYENGYGVLPKDYQKAKYWYEKAALQGNPYAQDALKRLQEKGY